MYSKGKGVSMEPKKKRKGIGVVLLVLVFIIPLVITAFLLQQDLDSDLKKGTIASITVQYEKTSGEVKEKDEISFFVTAVTGAESIGATTDPLSSYRCFEVTFHKPNNDLKYHFYLSDSVNNCVFTDAEGKLHLLSQDDAAKILDHPLFSNFAMSYAFHPSLAFVTQGQKSYTAAKVVGEWTYRRADQSKSTKKVQEETETLAVLPQGESFSLQFSIDPDFCSVLLVGENEELLYSGDLEKMEALSFEQDTELEFVVTCDWYEDRHPEYYGTVEYTFRIFYDIPTLVTLDRTQARPGESLALRIAHSSSESFAVNATFSSEKVLLERSENVWLANVVIPEDAVPGDYSIMVVGSDVDKSFPVTVLPALENP